MDLMHCTSSAAVHILQRTILTFGLFHSSGIPVSCHITVRSKDKQKQPELQVHCFFVHSVTVAPSLTGLPAAARCDAVPGSSTAYTL